MRPAAPATSRAETSSWLKIRSRPTRLPVVPAVPVVAAAEAAEAATVKDSAAPTSPVAQAARAATPAPVEQAEPHPVAQSISPAES